MSVFAMEMAPCPHLCQQLPYRDEERLLRILTGSRPHVAARFKAPVLKFDAGRAAWSHPMSECVSFQHLRTVLRAI